MLFNQDLRLARRQFLTVAGSALSCATLLAKDADWKSTGNSSGGSAFESQIAAERVELCSSSNPGGVGLRGTYYAAGVGTGSPLYIRTDSVVDLDPLKDLNSPNGGQLPHSVRWTGWVKPIVTGEYRFHVSAKQVSVLVSGKKIVDHLTGDQTLTMAAGRYYPITVDASDLQTLKDRLRLEWTTPYGARFVVPRALLYLPSETAS